MTDPTEQTAGPTVSEVATFGFEPGSQVRVYIDNALRAVGVDPSMPVAQLAADLAIAARARACWQYGKFVIWDPDEVNTHGTSESPALLAYLLNGEQP